MGTHPLNSHFTKQFRQEHTVYFGTDETLSHNLLFKTLGINESETHFIGKWIAPQLNDENIIQSLLVSLTNNDTPDAERIQAFIQETCKEFCINASTEPHTSSYYNHLLEELNSFLSLVDEFTIHGIHMLLIQLTDYYTHDNEPVDSEAIRNLYDVIDNFKYRMDDYYQHFHMLLQKESESNDNNARVLVMSYVAYYLDTLISHTEKLIHNTESTLDMLCAWETAILNREAQVLYN